VEGPRPAHPSQARGGALDGAAASLGTGPARDGAASDTISGTATGTGTTPARVFHVQQCLARRSGSARTSTGADVVHHADDRPQGLVEGTVLRDDVPPAEVARPGTPGSC